MKATKRKAKKPSPSRKRSPVAARRSKPRASAGTARSRSAAVASSATPSAEPSTNASAASAQPKAGSSKLSAADRRALFTAAYLANGMNATDAAKSAGFSEKTAYSQGSRLLKRVEVVAAIDAAQVKLQQKHHVTLDRSVQELARIAFFDPGKLFHAEGEKKGQRKAIHEMDDDTRAAIGAIEFDDAGAVVKVRGWDKNSALEKALRMLGAFKTDLTPHIPAAPGPSMPLSINVTLNPSEALLRLLGKG